MATEERKKNSPLGSQGANYEQPEQRSLSGVRFDDRFTKRSLLVLGAPASVDGSSSQRDESEEDEPSQVTLSQTDEQIRQLESDGALNQVVGSQSVLSQELLCSSQREAEEEEEDEEEGRYSQFQECSQLTETSTAMAQRLGLLTQDDEPSPRDYVQSSGYALAGGPIGPRERALSFAAGPPWAAAASPNSSMKDTASQPTGTPKPRGAASARKESMDTPIRESECFGSLLDAVQAITEQEEVRAKLYALQQTTPGVSIKQEEDEETAPEAQLSSRSPKRKSPPKPSSDDGASKPPATSSKKPRKSSSKKVKETEQRNAQEIAKRAAALAEQTVADPEMAKKLLLSMALVRENPRTLPSTWPPRGSVVPEGFFWAHYPPLEGVLKKHMAEYYELSTTKCQSAQQQAFNNELVVRVRQVSKQQGWKFNKSFSDKCLRDRIRCYYKTHIQNAKKRLRTMVRNPTKKANARHLCSHLDLIEKYTTTSNQSVSSTGSSSDVKTEEAQTEAEAPETKPARKTTKKPRASVKASSTATAAPKARSKKTSTMSQKNKRKTKPAPKQAVVEA